jgi:hypothetical protein
MFGSACLDVNHSVQVSVYRKTKSILIRFDQVRHL